MKKLATNVLLFICLVLITTTQAQEATKTQSSVQSELIVSSQARDYPGFLSVEPNPVGKICTVHCTPNLKNGKIIIYSLTGKVVAKYEDVQSGLITLENKNISPGVYLLQLRDNDVTIQTRRIVVE